MRIAIVTEGYLPELSGVTTSLFQRLRCLSNLGHTVRLYAPDYAPLERIYPDYRDHVGNVFENVTVVPFPSVPYYVDYTRDPKPLSFFQVAQDLAQFAPDVVHAECPERLFMGFLSRPGVAHARKRGIPCTAFYHTNYLAYVEDYKKEIPWLRLPGMDAVLKKMIVWVYNSFDVTMVPSRPIHQFLVRAGIHNARHERFLGVDTEQFKPTERMQTDRAMRLIYVGRFTPDKQLDLLLEAFERIRRATPRCEFLFVGGGPEEARIGTWIGGRSDARILGRVAHDKIHACYQDADIFITASTKENHPLTVQEAMACGLPVIAPSAAGMPSMVAHERTGILVPPDDAQALAQAALRLLAAPSTREQLGRAARQHALGASWEATTENMLRIWAELRDTPFAARPLP